MVGLTLALDLGRRGVRTLVIDEDVTVADGSRAIVFARRSWKYWPGLAWATASSKGCSLDNGTIFLGDDALLSAKIIDDPQHEYPLFLNIQQYYLEAWLVEACLETGFVELRWGHRLSAVRQTVDHATLDVSTPEGSYASMQNGLSPATERPSFIRKSMSLPFVGRVFKDRFLIAGRQVRYSASGRATILVRTKLHPGGALYCTSSRTTYGVSTFNWDGMQIRK